MHKSSQESDEKKKILNFEQNNVLAGLLKKLVGQLPLDSDVTPKNYDPIDPNKSVFAKRIIEKPCLLSPRNTPAKSKNAVNLGNAAAKSKDSLLGSNLGDAMKDVWVTHVQKHHSKHLVYQGINLNRRLLEMNLEVFAQVSTNVPKTTQNEGKVQTFQDEKL